MSIKNVGKKLFQYGIVLVCFFAIVFLYHSKFEPFRLAHPEYFRWISEYEVPDRVTIIEKKEEMTIVESDFVPKLIVNSQNIAITLVSEGASASGVMAGKTATGFFVTNDGVVAVPTEDVVLEKSAKYRAFLMGGEEYEAVIIGSDSFTDLTFFRTGKGNSPVLTVAPKDAFFVGRNILFLGRSIAGGGVIAQTSALAEMAKTKNIARQSIGSSEKFEGVGRAKEGDYVASGSAVITYQGELLGMSREVSLGGYKETIVIPAQAITDALNFLNQEGNHTRPFLGASYVSLTPELAKIYGLPVTSGAWIKVPGVTATVVLFNSPAYDAGLRQGDIVTAVNGSALTVDMPLSNRIAQLHPGDAVTLTVYRDGSEKEVSVTLDENK